MDSHEWDIRGWKKCRNPSGEMIRIKTYSRMLPLWDNGDLEMLKRRELLADILGIHAPDLNCDLEVTVKCNRYRRNGRLLKRLAHR